MTTSPIQNPIGSLRVSAPLPLALLENLAARYRPGGLCLLLLARDGSLLWHDPVAPLFFQKYLVPVIATPESGNCALADKVSSLAPNSTVAVWDVKPGIALSGFPYVERRQWVGILVVAGKSSSFRMSEDVVRICGRLGVDGIWLNQQAEELPGYPDEAIQRQARLLLGSLRDQQRLAGLESELSSISGQLTNTYEELSLIYQISSGMKISRRPADFFRQACLDSIDVLGARAMGVSLRSNESLGQLPVLYGSLTLSAEKTQRLSTELMTCLSRRKSLLLSNDLRSDKQFAWLADDARRLLAVPLQRGEQVLGCMYVLDKELGDFDSVDIKLLNSIANESAIYLENAILFEDVHGLMMGLLHSLTSAVDAKDAYTCGHSERVALLSKTLAQEFGLDDHQVERIYMAGLLHDVGKIGVPEAVLRKPGKLTVEEFEQMKRHPAIGAKILHDVKQIQDIIPGVLHHHERFDGRGYPDGLSGHNIPLMGRIICLADCFDAMTSTRTYRKAMPLEVTLADIRRCSGTQFDPALTEAFLRIAPEKLREIVRQQDVPSSDEERNGTASDQQANDQPTRELQPGKAA
jgi:HD-GYP domain-containing protein (c-di-GMP phosphodiesterase class II)